MRNAWIGSEKPLRHRILPHGQGMEIMQDWKVPCIHSFIHLRGMS